MTENSWETRQVAMSWYNFKTGDYDWLYEFPSTDEQAKLYISQFAAAQSLYDLCRTHLNMDVSESMLYVLKKMAGE